MGRLLNLTEAADLVGRTRKSLAYRVQQGMIPHHVESLATGAQRFLVDEDDVLAIVWRGERSANPSQRHLASRATGLRPEEGRRLLRHPHLDGVCRDADPDIFFADDEPTQAVAKAVCADCPVAAPCRDWGLLRETYGIYGGLTAKERVALRGTRVEVEA